jgi:hypothetical protein
MNEYQCWFCDQGIERTDAGAVMVTIENLWRWDVGSPNEDDPLQSIYAHSSCAKRQLTGATMELEPSLFGDDG